MRKAEPFGYGAGKAGLPNLGIHSRSQHLGRGVGS